MRSLFLIVLGLPFLPLACSEDNPVETREEFCNRWAQAACSEEVISVCQAASADACRLGQEDFCLQVVPTNGFVDDRANACIDAVGNAYADADLTAAELATVVRLQAPCDQLVRGSSAATESCTSRLDCDGPAGFDCVFKGSDTTTGSCQSPVIVEAGRDCSASSAVCTEGFYCDGDNCVEGNAVGETCARNAECATGFCDPSGVCRAALAVDTACTLDEQCASGICYQFSAAEQVCTDRIRLSRTDPLCDGLR